MLVSFEQELNLLLSFDLMLILFHSLLFVVNIGILFFFDSWVLELHCLDLLLLKWVQK